MFGQRTIVKSLSVLFVCALPACSGGGAAQQQIPVATQQNSAQAVDTDAVAAASGPFSPATTTLDTCALTSPCISGTNTSSGAGVFGISTNGRGVSGATKHISTSTANAMYGVYGQDLSSSGRFNGGVYGNSPRGNGVYGNSVSGDGVYGNTVSAYGVVGISEQYAGVYGQGNTYGVTGHSQQDGVYGVSEGTGNAVEGYSPSGTGVFANGGSGGLVAESKNGDPIAAQDPNAVTVFYVDNAGNVFYRGSLMHLLSTHGGHSATEYTPSSTHSTIEDTGTAHLVAGSAVVRFDASLARAMDASHTYQVFLTPDGDTRGLYIASKSAAGFTVREVQGGRGTFDFDYHVYARQTAR